MGTVRRFLLSLDMDLEKEGNNGVVLIPVYGCNSITVNPVSGYWKGKINASQSDSLFITSWTSSSSDSFLKIKSAKKIRVRTTIPGSYRPSNDKSPITDFGDLDDTDSLVYANSLNDLVAWKTVDPKEINGVFRYTVPLKKLWQKILVMVEGGSAGNIISHTDPAYDSLTHRVYGNIYGNGGPGASSHRYEQTINHSLFEVTDCYGSGAEISGGISVFESKEKISFKYFNMN